MAIPPVFGDARRAWTADLDGRPVRVEAVSFRGRPIWFRVADPDDVRAAAPGRVLPIAYVFLSLFLLTIVLARRHLRSGRGDREGARRIAAAGLAFSMLAGALTNPRALEPSEFMSWLPGAVFNVAFWWACYLALEPLVRRRWPHALVSWTRLMRGRVRDPLVGADVLVGVVSGVSLALCMQAFHLAGRMSWPASPSELAGVSYALAGRVRDFGGGTILSLVILMIFAFLRQALRRTWAATIAMLLVFQLLVFSAGAGSGAAGLWGTALNLLSGGLILGVLIRRGLLSVAVAISVQWCLGENLMTTHLRAWYSASAISGILATLAFAAWGFYASLGGRPPFSDPQREVA